MTYMFKMINYCLQRGIALEMDLWVNTNLILLILCLHQDQQACLKKEEVELELLTDNDMLLMIEEGIRGEMCQAVYSYAKAKKKIYKKL